MLNRRMCSFLLRALFSVLLVLFFTSTTKMSMISKSVEQNNIGSPYLVVLILSAPSNIEYRKVIRETWLNSTKNGEIQHVFSIGYKGLSHDRLTALQHEQELHNDILLLPIEENQFTKVFFYCQLCNFAAMMSLNAFSSRLAIHFDSSHRRNVLH